MVVLVVTVIAETTAAAAADTDTAEIVAAGRTAVEGAAEAGTAIEVGEVTIIVGTTIEITAAMDEITAIEEEDDHHHHRRWRWGWGWG